MQEGRSDAWESPPIGMMPGVVAVQRVVAVTDRVAIALMMIEAYPEGCLVHYAAAVRPGDDDRSALKEVFSGGPEALRFEFVLPGGARLSTLDGGEHGRFEAELGLGKPAPEPPFLSVYAGPGGAGGRTTAAGVEIMQPLWLWPLPPRERITVTVHWSRFGLAGIPHEIDGDEIHRSAREARYFW